MASSESTTNYDHDPCDPVEIARRCCVCQTITPRRLSCSRCKEVVGVAHYCSRECQKLHWKGAHKLICVDIQTTQIIRLADDGDDNAYKPRSLEPIRSAIKSAPEGAVIIIPCGQFIQESKNQTKEEDDRPTLVIDKPIMFLGDGLGRSILECNLQISPCARTNKQSSLVLSRVCFHGTVQVSTRDTFDKITFLGVRAAFSKGDDPFQQDRFTIQSFRGSKELLLYACEIIGGSNGLVIQDAQANVRITGTEIMMAMHRGIFSNAHFKIGNSKIEKLECTGCGIECPRGWTETGFNQIPPGP